MKPELEKKVERAIRLIKMTVGDGQVEVSYSSGKDSEVILELTKMAGVDYRAIYKNTTIDPPHTIAHCKSKGVEIMQPTITFFDLIKKKGFPTRRARFCCEKLKEYKVRDIARPTQLFAGTTEARRTTATSSCLSYRGQRKMWRNLSRNGEYNATLSIMMSRESSIPKGDWVAWLVHYRERKQ